MTTIISDSFLASLGMLSAPEQRQARAALSDLRDNPEQPGLQVHRIDQAASDGVWSARVNRDVRIIFQRDGATILLAYVGHHDAAYDWARRRRIGPNPATGAMQIVEVRELVQDRPPPSGAVGTPPPAQRGEVPAEPAEGGAPRDEGSPLFAALTDDQLLSIGVPGDWLADVKQATDDSFFDLAQHLPPEAADALMEYAQNGALPTPPPPAENPLEHPDTQRRFRVLDNLDELKAALEAPFEKWAVFLHPSQRAAVERVHGGPARVVGSAGTGKTVVALHRVMRLLHASPDSRILLATFSDPLSRALATKLRILVGDRPDVLGRVRIGSFDRVAADLYELTTGRKPHLAKAQVITTALSDAARNAGVTEVTRQFLESEWYNVIDAWQIETADTYGEVPRLGRKSRLGAKQRDRLWPVFEGVRKHLAERALLTEAGLFATVTAIYAQRAEKPFDNIVVDEAQDLGVPELRFLSAIAPGGPDALFFAGDIGQRIFRQPFSWKTLGVDVRGRSATLKVNYRTSHQIRAAADRLLPTSIRDVDGLEDNRQGTISVFEGPNPEIVVAKDIEEERDAVADRLKAALGRGVVAGEIGIFVRSEDEMPRARAAVRQAGLEARSLGQANGAGEVLVGTMHLAKGLEFRLVVLMACDEGVIPSEQRLKTVADDFELDEVLKTERQLLYVAATRARDRLIVTAVAPGSPLLDDLR